MNLLEDDDIDINYVHRIEEVNTIDSSNETKIKGATNLTANFANSNEIIKSDKTLYQTSEFAKIFVEYPVKPNFLVYGRDKESSKNALIQSFKKCKSPKKTSMQKNYQMQHQISHL